MYKTTARRNGLHTKAPNKILYRDVEMIKRALAKANSDVKGRARDILSHTIDDAVGTGVYAQERVTNFTATKPFTSLGIALLTGLFLGVVITKLNLDD